MRDPVSIALVGDFDAAKLAHQCIPTALDHAGQAAGVAVSAAWIASDSSDEAVASALAPATGVWVVPGSPYRNTNRVLDVIREVREQGRAFLGTCGGFQHALLEIAHNLLGADARHAEIDPAAPDPVVAPLACSLVEKTDIIRFAAGSRLHELFAGQVAREGYHCNYGVNTTWRTRLESAGVRFTGHDDAGDIRAMELPAHPFFVGTPFQPERSARSGVPHPLITAFVRAAAVTRSRLS